MRKSVFLQIEIHETVVVLLLFSAFSSNSLAISFEDSTLNAGIDSSHFPTYEITGQAWGDYDNDGRLDLYLTDSTGLNTLYRNLGDGTFEVSPYNAQVSLTTSKSGGATFADYDNDGDQDLLVLNQAGDNLFENTGSGFADVTASAGLSHTGEGESAAWGDFNSDGYLDVYIANWWGEDEGGPLSRDRLYVNDGDGTFTDVTNLLDFARVQGPAFAVTFLDYDNDNDLDIYVVNDKFWGNLLWRNDGSGCGLWCFTDVSVASGADRPIEGMGIAVGDYDLDGDDDLYFSGEGEMALLQNQLSQGSAVFTEVTGTAGVNSLASGWGAVFVDFDNDGWEDLYLATADGSPGRTDRVFRNLGNSTFQDVSDSSGASNTAYTMGVAYADYDNDGLVDLVVGNFYEGYVLYHNTTEGGDWLSVKLTGSGPINRDAVGTLVLLNLSDGRQLRRRVHIGSSIGADHQRALHFGMGSATPVSLEVHWPNGVVDSVSSVPTNQVLTLSYPITQDTVFENSFEN